MNKKVFLLGLVVIVGLTGLVMIMPQNVKAPVENFLGGGNLPDRCVQFTQIASRSVKDRVKAAPGQVLSFSVTSSISQPTYFQLYDQTNLPITAVRTPLFSIPIPGRTSATVPSRVYYDFAAPLSFTASGVVFAISDRFTRFGSSSAIVATDVAVEVCYY